MKQTHFNPISRVLSYAANPPFYSNLLTPCSLVCTLPSQFQSGSSRFHSHALAQAWPLPVTAPYLLSAWPRSTFPLNRNPERDSPSVHQSPSYMVILRSITHSGTHQTSSMANNMLCTKFLSSPVH